MVPTERAAGSDGGTAIVMISSDLSMMSERVEPNLCSMYDEYTSPLNANVPIDQMMISYVIGR